MPNRTRTNLFFVRPSLRTVQQTSTETLPQLMMRSGDAAGLVLWPEGHRGSLTDRYLEWRLSPRGWGPDSYKARHSFEGRSDDSRALRGSVSRPCDWARSTRPL